MLRFTVDARPTHAPWQFVGGQWLRGRCFVEPFSNAALDQAGLLDGDALVVIVRERVVGGPRLPRSGSYPAALIAEQVAETERWAGEFVIIRLDREVVITVGAWGAAPLYLCAEGNQFSGSWDVLDLRHAFRSDDLDEHEVVAHLAMCTAYTSRTLFRGVHRLTERAQALWAPGLPVKIRFPDPAVHYRPRTLRPDARVLEAYDALLTRAALQRAVSPENLVAEVSGGTDSATVALAAALRLGKTVASYGLLVGGEAGTQQVMRRRLLTALAGLDDHVIDAAAFPPLAPTGGSSVDPGGEPYGAALAAAVDLVDRPVVLTGIGGDELFTLRPDEKPPRLCTTPAPAYLSLRARTLLEEIRRRPPDTPVSRVPESALQACLVRAPTFLRAGRWPVAPLCDPDLIRFCEWLPAGRRAAKRLARNWLTGEGLAEEVVWPRKRENFDPVMQHALHRYGLPGLDDLVRHGSVLTELGLVEHRRLIDLRDTALIARAANRPLDPNIYELLVMERFLRTLPS